MVKKLCLSVVHFIILKTIKKVYHTIYYDSFKLFKCIIVLLLQYIIKEWIANELQLVYVTCYSEISCTLSYTANSCSFVEKIAQRFLSIANQMQDHYLPNINK